MKGHLGKKANIGGATGIVDATGSLEQKSADAVVARGDGGGEGVSKAEVGGRGGGMASGASVGGVLVGGATVGSNTGSVGGAGGSGGG